MEIRHTIEDILLNSYFITSLVLVMMILIEYVNVASAGRWLGRIQDKGWKQVLTGSLLGLVPGCIGGFAAVSLYAHGILGLGGLVAAMVASSGDEAFVMLAMIPRQALALFAVLFVIAIICGLITDAIFRNSRLSNRVEDHSLEVHAEHEHVHGNFPNIFRTSSYRALRSARAQHIILIAFMLVFAVAVFSGVLEHEHVHATDGEHVHAVDTGHSHDDCISSAEVGHSHHEHSHAVENELDEHGHFRAAEVDRRPHLPFNLLSERWMNVLFGVLSVFVALLLAASSDHFVREHIWNHVVRKHALKTFLWTAGALVVITVGMQYLDVTQWVKDNAFYLIILAALVGMIPESGPHIIFITLFASGVAPFSVLLASSMSQDGHTSLPLLASSTRSFLYAKLLNAAFAILIGTAFYLCGF